jgi:ADP-heptose:LPS heptosyltransferase
MARASADLEATAARSLGARGADATVLVVRLGALGDVVRTVPAVRLLVRHWPDARFVWIVDRAWRGVLEGHPDLAGIVDVPRRAWGEMLRTPTSWPALVRTLAEHRRTLVALSPKLVVDFHGDLRSGLLGWVSGAPIRVGFAGHQQREGNWLFSTHRVPSTERRAPRMERNLSLVRALGAASEPLPRPDLALASRGREEARSALAVLPAGESVYAVLAPGASARQAYKKPPPAVLAAAADELRGLGAPTLVVWGPGEEADARAVVALAPRSAILAPPTSLAALAALLERARLFVGGDSGPMHLACAVGCPVVAIYGPTDPRVNQPWGVPYRVVAPRDRSYTGRRSIDREQGFAGLDAIDVVRSVTELWAETVAVRPGASTPGDGARWRSG